MLDNQQQQQVITKPPSLTFVAGTVTIGVLATLALKMIFQNEIDRFGPPS